MKKHLCKATKATVFPSTATDVKICLRAKDFWRSNKKMAACILVSKHASGRSPTAGYGQLSHEGTHDRLAVGDELVGLIE